MKYLFVCLLSLRDYLTLAYRKRERTGVVFGKTEKRGILSQQVWHDKDP